MSVPASVIAAWPMGFPLPTDAEYAAARDRYHAALDSYPNDASDFGCGLPFLIGTYAHFCWGKFFGHDVSMPEFMRVGGYSS